MNCEHCGANLNIEDKFCPNCGMPNPFAVEHQKEMEHFTEEFNETKEEVIKQSGIKGRRAARITVIALLVAIICVLLVLIFKSSDIYYWRIEKEIESNKAEYTEALESYMEEDNFLMVGYYYSRHRLSWDNSFDSYYKVFECASSYRLIYSNCVGLMCYDDEINSYYSESQMIEDLSGYLKRLYESQVKQQYEKDEYFADGKKEYIDRNVEYANALIKTQFDLTDEEIELLPTMTKSRINVLLEDHYEQKTEEE